MRVTAIANAIDISQDNLLFQSNFLSIKKRALNKAMSNKKAPINETALILRFSDVIGSGVPPNAPSKKLQMQSKTKRKNE